MQVSTVIRRHASCAQNSIQASPARRSSDRVISPGHGAAEHGEHDGRWTTDDGTMAGDQTRGRSTKDGRVRMYMYRQTVRGDE
jgi:hypothetical protein